MKLLADRLNVIKPSPSMAAKARVEAVRARGVRVIDLTIGEPDFAVAPHIVEAGIASLRRGPRYTGPAGTPALREAVIGKFSRENALDYKATEIVVGTGAKQIIYCALAATLNEGDEVIVPAPYWVSYPDMVLLQGGRPVVVACPQVAEFKLTPGQLEAAITPRTRWLVLNSPNNPTGAVYSRAELLALAAVLERHPQVWVMTDEIYEHFLFSAETHHSIAQLAPSLKARTLLVNGVSKTYAMTGWRLGYAAGPQPLIAAIGMLISQSTSCANAMAQDAAVVALNGPQDAVPEAVAMYQRRRDLMCGLLQGVPGLSLPVPDGAFYVFPSIQGLLGRTPSRGSTLRNDLDVVTYFIDQIGVAAIDGTSYGAPGHVRLCFAVEEDLIEDACARLRTACEGLFPS